MKLSDLRVKIYADGADLKSICRLNENPLIKGFTTNPTLMRRAGINNYEVFARSAIEVVRGKPISFEVLSDEKEEMYTQAFKISKWGTGVYVKIPIINSRGESMEDAVRELSLSGISVNVTAILSLSQLTTAMRSLAHNVPSVLSVFAGRVADTGLDAYSLMTEARRKLRHQDLEQCELLWASVREPFNIHQADLSGCEIITVPEDILKKAVDMCDRNLEEVSLETVQMFVRDTREAGYSL